MIEIIISKTNVVTVKTQGALTSEDFSKLTAAVNEYINEGGNVPNLLVHADVSPHWNGIRALLKNLHLTGDKQKFVQKVAVIGDVGALQILPLIADNFLTAKVRYFSGARLNEAERWVAFDDENLGGFDIIDGLPDDVVAVEAKGIVTSQSYRDVLVPLVEKKLQTHDRLKILILLGEAFDSYSKGAVWDDVRFGFSHLTDFSKIALVTDHDWLRHGAKLFAPLVKADLHVFKVDELVHAKAWIKS